MAKSKYDNYTKEQLIDKIQLLEKQRYGLVWEDKPEAIANQCERELPVLIEDKTKEIINDPSKTTHLILEGDNYHSLFTLNFTHKRKIDIIYIDPPYNTGNKDFIYNDQFVDKTDRYRHSKWLSFLNKRLKLAKRLLSDKGVIFISIDDNEVAQLKLLCNNIFGENNFVAQLNWKARGGRQDSKNFAVLHEYILVYSKIGFVGGVDIKEGSGYNRYDPIKKKNYKLQLLRKWGANSKRENRPNLYYPIISPDKLEVYPMLDVNIEGCWRWSKSKMEKEIRNGNVEFVFKDDKYIPYEKIYQKNLETKKFTTWIDDISSGRGSKDLKEILNDGLFSYPKPIELIQRIIQMGNISKNAIILDFFAGSGTTGQAVLELNEQDNGNRQFILCTNNENKICEKVTYPRIKNVINGSDGKKAKKANIKYFRTDFVPIVLTDNDKRTLVSKSTELLCIAENTFEVVKQIKKKLDFAIFKNIRQYTVIIYDEDCIEDCCKELNRICPKNKVIIYVFSYDHTYDEVDFEILKINFDVKPIPEAILNVYRKISKLKRK